MVGLSVMLKLEPGSVPRARRYETAVWEWWNVMSTGSVSASRETTVRLDDGVLKPPQGKVDMVSSLKPRFTGQSRVKWAVATEAMARLIKVRMVSRGVM